MHLGPEFGNETARHSDSKGSRELVFGVESSGGCGLGRLKSGEGETLTAPVYKPANCALTASLCQTPIRKRSHSAANQTSPCAVQTRRHARLHRDGGDTNQGGGRAAGPCASDPGCLHPMGDVPWGSERPVPVPTPAAASKRQQCLCPPLLCQHRPFPAVAGCQVSGCECLLCAAKEQSFQSLQGKVR